MQVMTKLLALSKLRRFCALSVSKIDAMEEGGAKTGDEARFQPACADIEDVYSSGMDNLSVNLDESDLELLAVLERIAAASGEDIPEHGSLNNASQSSIADLKIEHDMVGQSVSMREVYRFISKVAPSASTVLIYGESGTGKELVARAIHQNSPRAEKPFLAINCAALTETLLESELFGHEKGSFTGALAQKKGRLEIADGGTVFLDELGELAQTLQAKLLRVLQERTFDRVGGTRPVKVDIRIIAATNKNLEDAVREGCFREDLYYRLNVVSLVMPPLRERREDITLLANYFTSKYGRQNGRQLSGISAAARSCLTDYYWPGNVRELENVIERAVVLGSSDMILQEDLPQALLEAESSNCTATTKYSDAVKESKKYSIIRAIEQSNGNYTAAAKLLGIHPNHLHRLVRNMNLRPEIKK